VVKIIMDSAPVSTVAIYVCWILGGRIYWNGHS
jgi:hypothetical protein